MTITEQQRTIQEASLLAQQQAAQYLTAVLGAYTALLSPKLQALARVIIDLNSEAANG